MQLTKYFLDSFRIMEILYICILHRSPGICFCNGNTLEEQNGAESNQNNSPLIFNVMEGVKMRVLFFLKIIHLD